MNSPSQSSIPITEPMSLRIGISIFAIVQLLANTIFEGSQNELLKNVLMWAFVLSIVLVAYGALKVVIHNEKLRLQTPEAKMRRLYLYFIGAAVTSLIVLPVILFLIQSI